jgi:hypothetical protein
VRRIGLSAVVGLLAFAGVALAGVPAETYYNGSTSQGGHVHLTLDGKRLAIFRYTATYVCPGGIPPSGEIEVAIPAELALKQGGFSGTFKDSTGGVEKIKGKLKGKQVSGFFSETFSNGGATCKTGTVTYKAKRGPRPKPGQP